MSEKVYHFGFGVDANYVKYAGILMTNLTELHPRQRLCFHFACDGIEADDQKRLAAFARQHRNVKIKLYDLSDQLDLLNPISKAAPAQSGTAEDPASVCYKHKAGAAGVHGCGCDLLSASG